MRTDCHICKSEGFEAQSRIMIRHRDRSIIATLNVVHDQKLLELDEAGLSEAAWRLLKPDAGGHVVLSHPAPLESLGHVRAKVYGQRLGDIEMAAIVGDIAAGRYADIQLSAFITACAGSRLDLNETTALTRAMIYVGDRLIWPEPIVVDKHCVGGLPGNRTTLIVVPIVAALGLTMPKTSSRAITSPAGTADTMETLAPVNLDIAAMRKVVERESACIIWGGSVQLSPADDVLIRVERPLDLDSEGQLVASVLSKKAAAGSNHVVIDIPVGPTAKVRSDVAARLLGQRLIEVGREIGLNVRAVVTDGSQPVGRGVGPALEARDVLAVLRGDKTAPQDLRVRALHLAAEILEMSGKISPGKGLDEATAVLADGRAWKKFQAICDAQGGMREPRIAAYTHVVTAPRAGRVVSIDNRRLARLAKLAGAPKAAAAGLQLHAPLGTQVAAGQPILTVHADAPGELTYALQYLESQKPIVTLGDNR